MNNKKNIYLAMVLGMFLICFISAVGEVSYCCEKTDSGAWCQNSDKSDCDTDYRKIPASCEATSYCKMGCCYDSQEGTCMENTPEKVCEDSDGVWDDDAQCDIPQCGLGCCLIGEQAAFVTQTRCKRLSYLYGLETDFRTDISNEISCIANAMPDVEGACVFEEDYETTCLFVTKDECLNMNTSATYENITFHEGYLCSDEALGTNCGSTTKTTCVEGKDEVYYLDSCGNLANIYDSSKHEEKGYWSTIYSKSESCNPDSSNSNSASCGNCDYYLGSTCKDYSRNKDKVKPDYGDNICRDLSCTYDGQTYEHGETWCADVEGVSTITIDSSGEITSSGTDLPGGRYFRLVCYDGDVTVEPCSDYRQEVCVSSDIDGFKIAACRVNKWQDCVSQDDETDCENQDKRDCEWDANLAGTGNMTSCFPKYSPGFDFWNTEGDATSICALANTMCTVTYKEQYEGFFDKDKECDKNCNCLETSWSNSMNSKCVALGDCGSSKNYFGILGYNNKSTIVIEDVEEDEDDDGGLF